MATHKSKTEEHKELMLSRVAILDRRGYSQAQIAERLGVSQPQISYDLKKLRERYAKTQLANRHELIQEKLEQYRDLRVEAIEAWEKSKSNAIKRTVKYKRQRDDSERVVSLFDVDDEELEEVGVDPEQYEEVSETIEGRLPANQYLAMIKACLDAERELLGLDAPKSLNVNQTTVVIDWASLTAPPMAYPDPLEQQLKALEASVPAENQCALKELPEQSLNGDSTQAAH